MSLLKLFNISLNISKKGSYNVAIVTGYGFVDFESPMAAEGAVKALVAKGIQAQMAKVGIWLLRRLDSVRGCACKYRVIPE